MTQSLGLGDCGCWNLIPTQDWRNRKEMDLEPRGSDSGRLGNIATCPKAENREGV